MAPQPLDSPSPTDRLVGDLGFHSLALVELAFTLEDLFAMEDMVMDNATGIDRVSDIEELVREAIDAGTARMPDDETLAELGERHGVIWEPTP
ncbi:acyl carrier protein [Streptacidiphilus sp. P02-A3a]|nr:acyl carrier protein [Streptacidiphilus sp. P02-A3a]